MIDAGVVRVAIAETFPFDATPAALTRLEKGHVQGKIVVRVAADA